MAVIVAGSSSGGGSNSIKIPFGYGDSTPELIGVLPAGSIVESVIIIILIAFDGSGAALTVGDTGDYSKLMDAGANDPTKISSYKTNPGDKYNVSTNIYISINPGAGASQGSGEVVINLV